MDGQTTVNINGKDVGVKFSVYGVQEMDKVKGNDSATKSILAMIWGGIQGYAFAKQEEPKVTFEEVFDWLESVQLSGDKTGEIQKINTAFETSQVYEKLFKPLTEKQQTSDTKKKPKTSPK